jgi:hypothetical protein
MLILFDHGTPAPLRSFLKDHAVKKTKDLGWDTLSNGELLRAAEEPALEIFLTTDKNIRYQQDLADRVIAIVVLGNSRWPVVQLYVDRIVAAITAAKAGTYTEVEIPLQLFRRPLPRSIGSTTRNLLSRAAGQPS